MIILSVSSTRLDSDDSDGQSPLAGNAMSTTVVGPAMIALITIFRIYFVIGLLLESSSSAAIRGRTANNHERRLS